MDDLQNRLKESARNGDHAGIRSAIDEGAVVDYSIFWHCLYTAEPARTLQVLIDAWGRDVLGRHVTNGVGYTALHEACGDVTDSAQLDCIRILLDAGIDVNAATDQGRTPLHMASFGNNLHPNSPRVLELLAQEGANIFARADWGAPFDCIQRSPLTDIKRAATAFFLDVYSSHVVQQSEDSSLHFILTAANFAPDERVELPLGTPTKVHMHSLLQLVTEKRKRAIVTTNQNGLSPLAAACMMNAPVYVIEFLFCSHPHGLSDI